MAVTARLTFRIGRRTVRLFIRPEYALNTSSHATVFDNNGRGRASGRCMGGRNGSAGRPCIRLRRLLRAERMSGGQCY